MNKPIHPAVAEHVMEENEKLRGLLTRCDGYLAAKGVIYDAKLRREIRAALSQQAEPTCSDERPCVSCFSDDGACLAEPAPAQDERDVHQYAFEVGGTEDGNYILMPEELDEVVRRAREPFEDVLRSLACSLGAGGYNAPSVDPAAFEQKIRWGIDQLTRPAQTEQQPIYLYRRKGQDAFATCDEDRFEELSTHHLFETKLAYAAPIAQIAPQPLMWMSRVLKGSLVGKLIQVDPNSPRNSALYGEPFAVYAAPIAQTATQVPPRMETEPYQTVDRRSTNYKAGWNACRKAMLEWQTAPQPEQLPYWEPCNPGCDPEFNGARSRHCAELCHNARAALSAQRGEE